MMFPRKQAEHRWEYYTRTVRWFEQWLDGDKQTAWGRYAYEQIWSWAGHIARMDVSRLAHQCLHSEGTLYRHACLSARVAQGHRGRGSQNTTCRWEYIFEKFAEQGGGTWIDHALSMNTVAWNDLASEFSYVATSLRDKHIFRP